jgi:hypothetical protein
MLPGWRRFGSVIYPMLVQLFERRLGLTRGSWEQRLLRVQLNSMPPGSEILPHSDTGSYARNAHRIHIPLIVPQCVQFEQRLPQIGGGDASWSEVPFKEGEAFEVNNLLPHHVQQHGPYERVTLILDLADKDDRSERPAEMPWLPKALVGIQGLRARRGRDVGRMEGGSWGRLRRPTV